MTTRSATAGRATSAPAGRDQVVAAILDHAADLFAERGPAATSIRDIAGRAGVNHGLVFRHFGAKDRLVGAVLDHLADELAAELQAGAPATGDGSRGARHWQVIARAILDGFPVGRLQQRFPNAEKLVEQAAIGHGDGQAARLAAAHTIALELGWRLFEPFLRSATGLGDLSEDALRDDLRTQRGAILTPEAR
jgi:AcrR family transcriptional regulator